MEGFRVVVGLDVVDVIGFSVLDFGSKSMTTGLDDVSNDVKELAVSLPDMAFGVLTEAFSIAIDKIC